MIFFLVHEYDVFYVIFMYASFNRIHLRIVWHMYLKVLEPRPTLFQSLQFLIVDL